MKNTKSFEIVSLHDKNKLLSFFQKSPLHHLFELGDLDDFFWASTIWYGLLEDKELKAVYLLFVGQDTPTLLAFSNDISEAESLSALLNATENLLPSKFYLHISNYPKKLINWSFQTHSMGTYYKMGLTDEFKVTPLNFSGVFRLNESDLSSLSQLYAIAYPDNFFDPKMLKTGQFWGIKVGTEIVSAIGVHIYSQSYFVAVPGNLATHPQYRGKGYAEQVMRALCQSLIESGIKYIGFNVKKDNNVALSLYLRLGFKIIEEYEQYILVK